KQLEQVAEELILSYPILTDEKAKRGWEPWLKSLQDKMSNTRRELKRCRVESVYVNSSARKQIRTSKNPSGISPNKDVVKARKGEVNFRPSQYPPGEDKETCMQHR
uniref:Uncharacterized protein n=1 Tax=Romanomermis culicivorax TaxID=13658 RepID=A0A915L5Q5_ROMCU